MKRNVIFLLILNIAVLLVSCAEESVCYLGYNIDLYFNIKNDTNTDLYITVSVDDIWPESTESIALYAKKTADVFINYFSYFEWDESLASLSLQIFESPPSGTVSRIYEYKLTTLKKIAEYDTTIRYSLVITDEMLGIPAEIETMEPETTETNEQSDENAEEQL
ncbi:MAG: hypothetical protein LBB22_04950 [Treponema sp.]|nr:hypothetical protein [Treponema sp.]